MAYLEYDISKCWRRLKTPYIAVIQIEIYNRNDFVFYLTRYNNQFQIYFIYFSIMMFSSPLKKTVEIIYIFYFFSFFFFFFCNCFFIEARLCNIFNFLFLYFVPLIFEIINVGLHQTRHDPSHLNKNN